MWKRPQAEERSPAATTRSTGHPVAGASMTAPAVQPISAKAALSGLIIVTAVLLSGCTTLVVPPAGVAHPTDVALLDHGRHSSLVIGREDGTAVRYAYGQWQWYALRKTGPVEASAALFTASPSALGRQELGMPVSAPGLGRAIDVRLEDRHLVTVETEAARRLLARLDAIFFANFEERVVNPSYNLVFVPHPEPYTLSHNSNSVVADWLRGLGCEVEGAELWARWRIEAPSGSPLG